VLGVAAGILWALPSDSYLYLPDDPTNVDTLVHVPGEADRDDGEAGVYMVDVVIREARLFERLFPQIYGGASVVPEDEFNPQDLPDQVRRERALEQMSASQQIATAVALRELGYTIRSQGVEVSEVEVGAPADGPLKPDDVIVEANGVEVMTPEELTDVMSEVDPGESVRLVIQRAGAERTVTVGTRASSDDPPRAIMGIFIRPELEFPIDIRIDAGDVGGPSAGLAFALDIYDELGEDLDDGRKIVVTGAIDLDGTVVPIGGIEQKTYAAHEADADLFVVPDENLDAARRYAGDTEVVAVSSFREALSVLTSS
jgi:PDZ domain-containing protein